MKELPKRKNLRLKDYDYASEGAYFVTFCANHRTYVFWENVGANCVRPQNSLPLSPIGKVIESEIQQIETVYRGVSIDKYCIMPDHIHMLIRLTNYELELIPSGEHSSPLQAADVHSPFPIFRANAVRPYTVRWFQPTPPTPTL